VAVQPLGNRDHVEWTRLVGEGVDGLEDQAMVVAIEVMQGYDVGDLVPCGVVQHQAAEHGLFGFDRVRWNL
jgi:hypothetical protein